MKGNSVQDAPSKFIGRMFELRLVWPAFSCEREADDIMLAAVLFQYCCRSWPQYGRYNVFAMADPYFE